MVELFILIRIYWAEMVDSRNSGAVLILLFVVGITLRNEAFLVFVVISTSILGGLSKSSIFWISNTI